MNVYLILFLITLLQEAQRNTLLKDTMRETCVGDLVNSWYEILVSILNHIWFDF